MTRDIWSLLCWYKEAIVYDGRQYFWHDIDTNNL